MPVADDKQTEWHEELPRDVEERARQLFSFVWVEVS